MSHDSPKPNFEYHMVSSSHWDREWYRSVSESRIRLERCLDRAIEQLCHDDEWQHYMSDGQTQMLVDYLESRPEQKAIIRQLNAEDKCQVGPWKVQPDTQIISGEAMVRNLLLGDLDAQELGGSTKHGYLADNFGHVSQTPQILNGFGIHTSSFWRGYEEERIQGLENRWISPDGSEVLALLMPRGYSSAAGYGPSESDNTGFENHLPDLQKLSLTGVMVMGDGTDHALPTPNLKEVLEFSRQRLQASVQHSTWPKVMARIQELCRERNIELPSLHGELTLAPGLCSVFSARLPQKQANMLCESLLTRYSEPLASLARVHAQSRYPLHRLRGAWDKMVKNAAHDSIAGCHSDNVARDVEHRYQRVEETARCSIQKAMDDCMGTFSDEHDISHQGRIVLYNPSPRWMGGVTEIELQIPDTEGRNGLMGMLGKHFSISDERGQYETHLLDDREDAVPVYSDRRNPAVKNSRRYKLWVDLPPLPPMGIKSFDFDASKSKKQLNLFNADVLEEDTTEHQEPQSKRDIAISERHMENDFVRITVHDNGSFDLYDKKRAHTYQNLNLIIDEQDCGNLYAFNAPKNPSRRVCQSGSVGVQFNSPMKATLRVDTTITCFDHRHETIVQRASGNLAQTVECPISIELSLDRHSAQVQIKTTLDNRGAGHRLKARFDIIEPSDQLLVNSVYDLVDRSPSTIENSSNGTCLATMKEQANAGMIGFQVVQKPDHGFCLAGKGLYEYKHHYDEGHCDLTLFRSIGNINLGFEAWGVEEKGYLFGQSSMEYAIDLFSDELFKSRALDRADRFLNPPQAVPYPTGAEFEQLGPSWEDPRLALQTFKAAECEAPDAGVFILRLVNLSEDSFRAPLQLNHSYRLIEQVSLDEQETLDSLEQDDQGFLELDVKPKKIISLKLRL